MMNPKDGGDWTEVGPHNTTGVALEDLPEAEKIALEKGLEEEMATTRRRKLVCFQKTRIGLIKKTVLAVMTTTTMTPTVTSNLTPKELVKLVDVLVTSKYCTDLTQFTRINADDMRNTLESFKTDLFNTLPRQVRSVV
jgi:CHAD domain-containing protein